MLGRHGYRLFIDPDHQGFEHSASSVRRPQSQPSAASRSCVSMRVCARLCLRRHPIRPARAETLRRQAERRSPHRARLADGLRAAADVHLAGRHNVNAPMCCASSGNEMGHAQRRNHRGTRPAAIFRNVRVRRIGKHHPRMNTREEGPSDGHDRARICLAAGADPDPAWSACSASCRVSTCNGSSQRRASIDCRTRPDASARCAPAVGAKLPKVRDTRGRCRCRQRSAPGYRRSEASRICPAWPWGDPWDCRLRDATAKGQGHAQRRRAALPSTPRS